jgi:hypothetical protein
MKIAMKRNWQETRNMCLESFGAEANRQIMCMKALQEGMAKLS